MLLIIVTSAIVFAVLGRDAAADDTLIDWP
jgi:hypothetical protein